ncbi:olfactory receptor 502-like [Ornithorhynchus anatinus]|uniref:Olfactory receptor n=1 Tax=Ornithorhynchus anatinus TaxID=9258 RepID=A0A6I8NHS2_ORNAN|nr:olfactory receptor 502-like [Ornithorhynchus anatinus]XP_039767343.1 olfactory receptor 502-like [Ornithorhynchus anatinus]
MANGNRTALSEFILSGLTSDPQLQIPLFILFLLIYMVTLLGNLLIVLIIRVSSQLHTPMYFFLSHLSFSDSCYSSSVTPKMLANFLLDKKTISYPECVAQFCVAATFGVVEYCLLAVMAYDRYVAICKPLLYIVCMPQRLCASLVTASYLASCLNTVVYTVNVFSLTFCGPLEINHFYCDVPPLLKLSCSDPGLAQVFPAASTAIIMLVTVLTTLISYVYILLAILKIQSSGGRQKAFFTCTSHLMTVTLFYGTTMFIYLLPSSSFSMDQKKLVSICYMILIPMLNPVIYSLRNKEVKDALWKVMAREWIG